jgi:hypothetical protein
VTTILGEFQWTSSTIGADGLPVVSYHNNPLGDLMVLHCGNTVCTRDNIITTIHMPSGKSIGEYVAIALGADGIPVISHFESFAPSAGGRLRILHCGNTTCASGSSNTEVDSGGGHVGRFSSIAIGSDGLPLISYYDSSSGDLKVLRCGNLACTADNITSSPDSTGDVGQYTSITIGVDGLAVASYFDVTNGDLKVLHCGNGTCTTGNTTTAIDTTDTVGEYTSIAIGGDGLAVVSYFDATNGDLKVLHCGNDTCTTGNTTTSVDTAGTVGQYTSIAIGADGLPVVSYYDATNANLKVLHCGNVACTSKVITTADSTGNTGAHSSITIGVDGLPVVSYVSDNKLRVLHCSNPFCAPYFRRR